MGKINQEWLQGFDAAMKKYFAIDHADAGMGDEQLSRYADLPSDQAALAYGEDYDLIRFDMGWR